ncbi:MAG: hypothetical protein QOC81_2891 [Thermoanaerobaculia bacterium]|nr:hypothetical protein [Thermoanaerobaculia bacterium]
MHGQRKLMAGQLEEMKTTSADTGALAAAAQQQAQWAEVSTHALNNQADALTNQARIMLTHTEAAVMAAEAAKGSASAMLRQLEAYERPWLTVSFEGTNADYAYLGFFPDGRAYMTFYPVVKNIGKSLATNVSIRTSLIAVERNASPVAFIRQLPLRTFEPDSEEFTLFPGEDNDRLEITKHTPKEEIAAASFDYRSDIPDRFVIMAVVGVVLDDFANSDGTHHTEFAYLIQQRNSPSPIPQALTPGLPLSGKEITWVKLPGNHAD